jgi:hypothetical protein
MIEAICSSETSAVIVVFFGTKPEVCSTEHQYIF